ncbi:MAG TPA: hypothetical protein VGL06_13835 [Pseudonocardiaceae bacterium]
MVVGALAIGVGVAGPGNAAGSVTPVHRASPQAASPSAAFTAIYPERFLDTRIGGVGAPFGPIGANATVIVDLSNVVPVGTTAVVFNLTGTDVTANTYVSVWPDGQPRPATSNLNLQTGAVTGNLVTVQVSAARKIDLYNLTGTADLVGDIAGYYATTG